MAGSGPRHDLGAPLITGLVLLGATGDLAGRFLLPALARSSADGQLPADLRVVGAAPQDHDDEGFRAHVAARLAEHAADVPEDARRAFGNRLAYRRVDLDDAATVAAAVSAAADAGGQRRPVAVYLALPPGPFPAALRALAAADLPPGSRVAVEKPFGEDLAGAVALNALLAEVTGGDAGAVFRTDHALAMPGVQDLLAQRAPGGPLDPVWDGASVEQVELLWEEVLGLEGRADFYDRTGALKDVLQNHLLQLMVLAAVELPAADDDAALHEAKLALLQAVHPPSGLAPQQWTRRARYTAGRLAGDDGGPGRAVPDYAAEDGVDPARGTETYAEVVLEVDAPRWARTRFVLRTAKALAAGRKGVLVHLRDGAAVPEGADAPGRRLWLDVDGPARDPRVSAERTAYSAVLLDVLRGGSRYSVSAEESEQAWRVVEPVLEAWARGAVPLLEHPAGSSGPAPSWG